jgi:STAM-binding protein
MNGTGLVSGDPNVNPDFWAWNVAYLIYCDGASFSGNKDNPIVVNGTSIYFRGRRILDTVINDLIKRNLNKATHVILTGCSAGGLSTFLHTNYVGARIPSTAVFKSIPQSGYFLNANNLDNKAVYPSEMKYVYNMQNASGGVDVNCSQHTGLADRWKCIFAPSVYPYISAPIFVLNSYYDSWQMSNILGAQVSSFKTCASKGPESCTPEQIRKANTFHHTFVELIEGSSTFKDPRNGVFLNSCWTHCASVSDTYWMKYTVGGVTMRDAVGNWFFERTSSNNYIDCTLHTTKPYRCNPTCPS